MAFNDGCLPVLFLKDRYIRLVADAKRQKEYTMSARDVIKTAMYDSIKISRESLLKGGR